MRITKYPQSHFVIEDKGDKITIDPGFLTFEKYKSDQFKELKAVLITHQHLDHLDRKAVEDFKDLGIPIFGNKDVADVLKRQYVELTIVENAKEFEIGNFHIKPLSIPHCQLLYCRVEGKVLSANDINPQKKCKLHPTLEPEVTDGPPNTAYLINRLFLHPGDAIESAGTKVKNAAVPINGPTIDFERSWNFVDQLEAKTIIPMHYDHPTFKADPKKFIEKNTGNTKVLIIADGETKDIS